MTAPTVESVIRVRGLTRRYGSATAVDDVDLDVLRGEVFALLGPNGSGKTTLVEILEGYRRRDAGEVAVLGVDPAAATAAWRSRIGVVLQSVGDLGELTAGEAVRHFARYYPHPRDPDEVLAKVGLAAQSRTRLRRLSGGQRRRLDVALGILGHPEVLFLDEPTTGFDPQARRQFWVLIAELAREGTTILLTTHYLEEAEHLADRVGVIAAGRLLAVAPPAELGGRAVHTARVSWHDDTGTHSVEADRPTDVVLGLAERYGGEVPGLSVVRPSLEDVYLKLLAEAEQEVLR